MSNNNRFLDKLKDFVFGPPIPILSERDLQTLDELRQYLALLSSSPGRPPPAEPSPAESGPLPAEATVAELVEQVRKLGKAQFKTNTLQESQLAQQQAALESLQKSVAQQEELMANLTRQREQAVQAAQLELLKSLLPILDSLDAAFESGRRQVLRLAMSVEARRVFVAWLDGLRLARLRLLDLLAAYQVTPIPTIGHPFDPHRHVAVATDSSGRAPDGVIVGEDRRGYATPTQVLRFAEVVVARASGGSSVEK